MALSPESWPDTGSGGVRDRVENSSTGLRSEGSWGSGDGDARARVLGEG